MVLKLVNRQFCRKLNQFLIGVKARPFPVICPVVNNYEIPRTPHQMTYRMIAAFERVEETAPLKPILG
jgi:hypothetical protein